VREGDAVSADGRNYAADARACDNASRSTADLDLSTLYAAKARGFLEAAREELRVIEASIVAREAELVRLSKLAKAGG
jgi:hypothetical protein